MPHCVRLGPSHPQQPLRTFGICLLWSNGRPSQQLLSSCYCGQTAGCIWMHQNATWHGGGPRPTRHCVRWVPSSPSLRSTATHFRPMSVVAKTAGWTTMSLGMKVGLGPGDFVFDWDPAAPQKKGAPHPGDVVLDGVAAPPKRGTAPSIRFRSIVAKQLEG